LVSAEWAPMRGDELPELNELLIRWRRLVLTSTSVGLEFLIFLHF
jgi:hypothetical protein